MNLVEILNDTQFEKQKDRFYGVAVALVTNNEDPENLGRVKIKFPWLSDENESHWARVAVLMAGNDTGTWFPLQIDEEVLVAFEHGDINRPIVIGAMWNGKDAPPTNELETIQIKDKHNNVIEFSSEKIIIDADLKNIEIKADNLLIDIKNDIIIKGKTIDFQKAN
jgi:phage baseplate assembly protein gpV